MTRTASEGLGPRAPSPGPTARFCENPRKHVKKRKVVCNFPLLLALFEGPGAPGPQGRPCLARREGGI